jgi:hypothetical protein
MQVIGKVVWHPRQVLSVAVELLGRAAGGAVIVANGFTLAHKDNALIFRGGERFAFNGVLKQVASDNK